jgi:hypothetical protein
VVTWDEGATLAERFRAHAGEREHLYGYAMRGMAADWEAGGAVRQVCAGYEDAPSGSAIQLRLLAGVFRLVLDGRAPGLRPYYPCLGGREPPAAAWPVMQQVVAEHVEELRRALAIAPQTNEVGRSAALLAGLFDLVQATGLTRVRLLEVGASAGLNLLVDRMHLRGEGWQWGPPDSAVQLVDALIGPVHVVPFLVQDRAGCDLSPVDVTTVAGRQLLTSFVWPFDVHRHARLAAALQLARQHPVRVDRAGASSWLPGELARGGADPTVLTVVWQSVTQLYWPAEEVAAVERAVAAYGQRARVARVTMEFDAPAPALSSGQLPAVRTQLWEPGEPEPRRRLVGTAHDHGIPVRLAPPDQDLGAVREASTDEGR